MKHGDYAFVYLADDTVFNGRLLPTNENGVLLLRNMPSGIPVETFIPVHMIKSLDVPDQTLVGQYVSEMNKSGLNIKV